MTKFEYSYKKACDLLGEGNSPHSIWGRDTDLAALGLSFRSRIVEQFPINEVPEVIVVELGALQANLDRAEILIERIIALVTKLKGDNTDLVF